MPRIATTAHSFRFDTPALPARVWSVLTTSGCSDGFFHGLALESDWEVGSPISCRMEGTIVLIGEVLRAEPPSRLSYTLSAGRGQPDTYITWDVRASASGSIVCLFVDDLDAGDQGSAAAEIEECWLPILAALKQLVG
jgi:uncharacterized protein YndB with AHSA1/START domain